MNYPLDDESLAQTNEDIFDIAQTVVNLAMAVVTRSPNTLDQAIDILETYADWHNIKIPVNIKRALYVRNYGEDEVEAMVEAGEVSFESEGT